MYSIHVDKNNKILNITIEGHMDINELYAYTQDVTKIVMQYEKKELSIIANLERLDPLAQDCLPICIEGLSRVSAYVNKISFIHKKVLTRMQFERIVDAVNSKTNPNLNYKICFTKEEALFFIKEKPKPIYETE